MTKTALTATTKRRRALALGAAATLMVGLGLTTLPAAASAKPAAASLDGLSFNSAAQSLHSNTHKTLNLFVEANQSIQEGTTSSSASIQVSRQGVPEMHDWDFGEIKNGTLAFDPGTGKGSLKTGSQLDPYAKLSLTLTATGKPNVTKCQTYKTITQRVNVRGRVSFDTRSTGKNRWGKVSAGAKYSFSGTNEVVYETGVFQSCGGNFTVPCSSGVNWNAFQEGNGIDNVSISGNIRKHGSSLFALRNASLPKPKNAVREDTVNIAFNKMSFSVSSSNKATVKVGAAGQVSGSATLASPNPGTSSQIPCGNAGKHESSMSWRVPYKNGKSPLTVHEQIEGSIKLPNLPLSDTGETSINKSTVS
jgi:hypothetical protein